MRKIVCSLVILINSVYLFAQWKPVGGRIMTEWAAKIDVENVLPEYPRPIMERADWINPPVCCPTFTLFTQTSAFQSTAPKCNKILCPFHLEGTEN